jgi:type II secretory pathway pseudopilin PulG
MNQKAVTIRQSRLLGLDPSGGIERHSSPDTGKSLVPSRRRSKGFSLVETLIASGILSLVVIAMFGSWSACFKESRSASEMTSAAEIGRAQLEFAKMWGAGNVVTGTYNTSTSTGSWTGAYVPGTGWVTGGTAYFNFNGTPVASAAASGAYFSAQLTSTDSNVVQSTGTSYTIQATSLRAFIVKVTNISKGVTDVTMATNLVEGGL